MKDNKLITGHILALVSVIFWGTSFIASKTLMYDLTAVQLMFSRFVIGYAVLWIICPKWQMNIKDEWMFFLAALCGNTIYFLFENTALTLTQTSNVSIIVTTAPAFTAILLSLTDRSYHITRQQIAGFAIAFIGVVLVVLNGSLNLKLSPAGDLLSMGAAFCWAVYSIVVRRAQKKYSSMLLSRKLMFYGIITSAPILLIQGNLENMSSIFEMKNMLCLLFLGIICSAACYVMWNSSISHLGVIETTVYIYVIPLVTLVAGTVFLDEKITLLGAVGMIVVISGLLLSELKKRNAG